MNSFPKIYALGHRLIKEIFDSDNGAKQEITEKVDGSQFGWGKCNGELFVRSKGRLMDLNNIDNLFMPAVDHVLAIKDMLPDNRIFWGETLKSPKHNTLAYERVPRNHIALFGSMSLDVMYDFTSRYEDLVDWANILGIDVVPLLGLGQFTANDIPKLMDTESFLGGPKIEGVVVKNYKQALMINGAYVSFQAGKFVSEAFKEKHGANPDWKPRKSKLEELFKRFCTEARWLKAVQHLRDDGVLLGEPKDIGGLIKSVQQDVVDEDIDEIKQALWEVHRKDVMRASTQGLPQWYKEQLLNGEVPLS